MRVSLLLPDLRITGEQPAMVIDMPVQGMHCDNCLAKVRAALLALPAVRHADVQLGGEPAARAGRVRVIGDVPRERIAQAIRDAGFDVPAA
jgi:copper chaperone CopZ